jgi:hypothetical protein
VIITSKSVPIDGPEYAVRNVTDFSYSQFLSKNEPGQWICLDFQEIGVSPTRSTIKSPSLQSRVIESSLEGED